MGKYADTHASALLDVAEAGSAVTFTHATPGTYDATTDTYTTPTTTTVTGYAIEVAGDPDTYKALSLVRSSAPALFFMPDTYGSLPNVGDTVTWNSTAYTVRDVSPLAPDGTAIGATIVVSV